MQSDLGFLPARVRGVNAEKKVGMALSTTFGTCGEDGRRFVHDNLYPKVSNPRIVCRRRWNQTPVSLRGEEEFLACHHLRKKLSICNGQACASVK